MSPYPGRHQPRRPLRVPLPVVVAGERGEPRVDYAIDLSNGGLCLQTDQPGAEGERVQLRFRLGPDRAEISVEAEVSWCTADEERGRGTRFHQVGLRFLGLSAAQSAEIAAFVDEAAQAELDR